MKSSNQSANAIELRCSDRKVPLFWKTLIVLGSLSIAALLLFVFGAAVFFSPLNFLSNNPVPSMQFGDIVFGWFGLSMLVLLPGIFGAILDHLLCAEYEYVTEDDSPVCNTCGQRLPCQRTFDV